MTTKFGAVQVVAVGKLQSAFWQAAQLEYQQRLRWYTDFQVAEVKDVVGRGQPDGVARQKEGELLLKAASGMNRLIALTAEGRELSSPELAVWMKKEMEGYGRIAFLIGGPLGFSPELLTATHTQLSLSRLTFPHELARILLLEQLYRAFTILNHEKYHK